MKLSLTKNVQNRLFGIQITDGREKRFFICPLIIGNKLKTLKFFWELMFLMIFRINLIKNNLSAHFINLGENFSCSFDAERSTQRFVIQTVGDPQQF